MKARTILLLLLAVAVAGAQTVPPSQKVAPAGKPAAAPAKPASTASQPAASQGKPAAAPAKPAAQKAQPARAQAAPAKKVPAKKPVTRVKGAAKPAAGRQAKASKPPGKRDPFLSVVVSRGVGGGPACETGKKCLDVGAIVLRGIVKAPSGMIAVVESSTRRVTYFLRENDPVFNGYVVKITIDSVVFRENVMDPLGRSSTREVVKRVQAPAV